MKSKNIVIPLIILLFSILYVVTPVYAENHTFTFTATPTQITAKTGDTVTVNLGIADIDQETDGINGIEGSVLYDEDLFESVKIVSSGSWSTSLNNEEGNPLKGKFVMHSMTNIKENGTVAVLEARIKSEPSVTTGTISLKDVCSSYGITETAKSNITITVNLEQEKPEEEPEGQPTPPAGETGNQSPNDEQVTPPEKENVGTQAENKNTSKAPSLPKAGLSSWIVVGIEVAIIVTVIGYIRYKKTY